jgi:enoyl-CoA hydratase/carnithine racemase
MSELVIRRDDDGVAVLSLNRPEVLNALSPALFVQLRAHVDALAADESIGVVVLRGEGRSFSAGNDLKAMQAGERPPYRHHQAETIDAIEALPQPVVGAVRGHCFTGGLELLLACDVIVAADDARIADTHGRWGMAPTWGMTQRLPRRVGEYRAREMMFTGREVSGTEAAAIGLANRSVPADEVDDAATAIARQMAGQSWWTLRAEKQLLAATRDLPASEGIAYEREHSPGAGPDMAERIAAGFGKKA